MHNSIINRQQQDIDIEHRVDIHIFVCLKAHRNLCKMAILQDQWSLRYIPLLLPVFLPELAFYLPLSSYINYFAVLFLLNVVKSSASTDCSFPSRQTNKKSGFPSFRETPDLSVAALINFLQIAVGIHLKLRFLVILFFHEEGQLTSAVHNLN